MVVAQLGAWQEVFEQLKLMSAHGLIQGFLLEYEPHTSELRGNFKRTKFFPVSSGKEIDNYAEILPLYFSWLNSFELLTEPVDREFAVFASRKVLLIRGRAKAS